MKRIIEFLIMLRGLYAGICLIFTSYAQWLAYLMEFFSEPNLCSALKTIFWIAYAGAATFLTGKLLSI